MKKRFKKDEKAYIKEDTRLIFKPQRQFTDIILKEGTEVKILKSTSVDLEETKHGFYIECTINGEVLHSAEPLPQIYLCNQFEWAELYRKKQLLKVTTISNQDICGDGLEDIIEEANTLMQNDKLLHQLHLEDIADIASEIKDKISSGDLKNKENLKRLLFDLIDMKLPI